MGIAPIASLACLSSLDSPRIEAVGRGALSGDILSTEGVHNAQRRLGLLWDFEIGIALTQLSVRAHASCFPGYAQYLFEVFDAFIASPEQPIEVCGVAVWAVLNDVLCYLLPNARYLHQFLFTNVINIGLTVVWLVMRHTISPGAVPT
jgi:hypothetical protein